MRWDYATPVTELYNRLVNLDDRARLHGGHAGAARPDRPIPARCRFPDPSGPQQLLAADRLCVAAVQQRIAGGARRIRHLLQHFGLQHHRRQHGAAAALRPGAQRVRLRGQSADHPERLPAASNQASTQHLCHRSELPHRLCADLEPPVQHDLPLRHVRDRRLSGHQGHAARPAVHSELGGAGSGRNRRCRTTSSTRLRTAIRSTTRRSSS